MPEGWELRRSQLAEQQEQRTEQAQVGGELEEARK